MKKLLAALITVGFFILPPTVSAKSSLLVRWLPYQQGSVIAEKIEIYRSINGGPFQLHQAITDLNVTKFEDRDVKWNRRYGYRLFAVTASGVRSLPSSVVYAKPFK